MTFLLPDSPQVSGPISPSSCCPCEVQFMRFLFWSKDMCQVGYLMLAPDLFGKDSTSCLPGISDVGGDLFWDDEGATAREFELNGSGSMSTVPRHRGPRSEATTGYPIIVTIVDIISCTESG